MKRAVAVAVIAAFCMSCGRGGGGNSSQEKSQSGAANSGKGSASGANKGDVTIDGEAQQTAGIRVEKIVPETISQSLSAAGQILMDEERTAHIGTYTDGRITEVHANIGDFVGKGAVLARMHSHEVHETRAAYQSALAEVARQQTAVDYQRRMRDRMLRLLELKSASKQEVERAETDLRSAQTDLANARISVQKEVAHLTDILNIPASQLSQITEETEKVPVVSPIAGVVMDRKITPGMVVEPGEEVFTVSDLSRVWMMAAVNETDIGKVRVGEKARVISDAFPDRDFPGRVTRISEELDPKTRTFQVRLSVPNEGNRLRVAMYVNAQIDEGRTRDAIFVPEEAVQDINGSSVVFLRTGENKFQPRAIEIARRVNGQAELASGLRGGEAAVVKGSFAVKSEMLKSQIGQ